MLGPLNLLLQRSKVGSGLGTTVDVLHIAFYLLDVRVLCSWKMTVFVGMDGVAYKVMLCGI